MSRKFLEGLSRHFVDISRTFLDVSKIQRLLGMSYKFLGISEKCLGCSKMLMLFLDKSWTIILKEEMPMKSWIFVRHFLLITHVSPGHYRGESSYEGAAPSTPGTPWNPKGWGGGRSAIRKDAQNIANNKNSKQLQTQQHIYCTCTVVYYMFAICCCFCWAPWRIAERASPNQKVTHKATLIF